MMGKLCAIKMCSECITRHKQNGWYLGDYVEVKDPAECSLHPSMSNRRVIRTLKTIKSWSLEPEGYCHPFAKAIMMNRGGGHVSRRTAEAIMFDYEQPFIDLLIREGYLEEHQGDFFRPTTLTITFKGDMLIREKQAIQVG